MPLVMYEEQVINLTSDEMKQFDWTISREYFKEVSIETKTIVETIEKGQGCDF